MDNKVLVTGAAGFIGSHAVTALADTTDQVVGIDNLTDYYDPQRKRLNLNEIRSEVGDRFTFIEGDIRDASLIARLFREHDFRAVIHLAAMAGVRASIENPDLYYSVNLDGTRVLLEQVASQSGKGANFVFGSTSSVYGQTERIPFIESDPCDRPLVPYSASKRAAEMACYSYHYLHEIDCTVLRFFTVYGPRGRPDMMPFKVADSIKNGVATPLYDGGQMYRDWTYVSDIVSGVVAAADRRLGYEIINLGRGEPVLVADFVKVFEDEFGATANLQPQPMFLGDVPRTFADITKARELLGYEPTVSVEDGVRRYVGWFSSTP